MTAPNSNLPVSIDYTGRDYYSLREQLIERVQARVKDWRGSDPSDFGLALVEAFAYMGDLVNYYIDRVANESYIVTATQRESLINLASMYGYTPSHYVSASTTLSITSGEGYSGAIGAGIIEDGDTVDGVSSGFIKLIVPNDITSSTGGNVTVPEHPWTDPATMSLTVTGVPYTATTTIGGSFQVTYNVSVFNGTYPVVAVGYDGIGNNVVWMRPQAGIDSIGMYSVTGATAASDGTTATYNVANRFMVGDVVNVTGFSTSSYNLTSALVDSVTDDGSSFSVISTTAYPVTIPASSQASGTGTVTATNRFTVTLADEFGASGEFARSMSPLPGQKIRITGATLTSSATAKNYNGKWVIGTVVDSTSSSNTKIDISTFESDTVATITKAVVTGSYLQYAAWDTAPSVDFVVGETVTVTGIKDSTNTGGTAGAGFNVTEEPITKVQDYVGVVSDVTISGSTPTYRISKPKGASSTFLASGDYITFRNIKSSTNQSAAVGVEYNATDVTVASLSTEEFTIENVTGQSVNGAGYLLYQTTEDHSFDPGDYVTITGVANLADDQTTDTDVYNLGDSPAKIMAVPASNQFLIIGYWSNLFDADNSASAKATLYKITTSSTASSWGTIQTGGGFISRYFQVAKGSYNPGTWVNKVAGDPAREAVAIVGGTYDTSVLTDQISYAPLPTTLMGSGQTVNAVGSTTVPAGTQVSARVTSDGVAKDIIFSTQTDTVVPYRSTVSGVVAVHGENIALREENLASSSFNGHPDIDGELLGFSTGNADQSFLLNETTVPTSSIQVFVDNGVFWEEWTKVSYIQDQGPLDKVFQAYVNAVGEVSVLLGDGISGYIPVKGSGIKAKYISGGGTAGNISSGAITSWNKVSGPDSDVITSKFTLTNDVPATGGTDPETDASIRYNAPRALRALNRAVTLQDFADLSLSVDGIAKSNSVGTTRSSVTTYIAPFSSGADDLYPGLDSDGFAMTLEMVRYLTQVESVLSEKCQVGTTNTVLPPRYSLVTVKGTFSCLPNYNSATVLDALKKELTSVFGYDNAQFGEVITPEEVEFQLRQVDGVNTFKVTDLYRYGGSGRNTLVGNPDEIFVFTGNEATFTSASSGANLLSLGITIGATTYDATVPTSGFSPKLNADAYTYTLSGIAAGTISPEVQITVSENASAAVNDKSVSLSSGSSPSGSVTTTSATLSSSAPYLLVVTVTAQDGMATKTYRIRVTT